MEEANLKQLQFLAIKHKIQLYSLDPLKLKTQGGIYRHQGKGGHVGSTWPKAQARAPPKGRGNAARVAFPRPRQGGARPVLCSASPSLLSDSWMSWIRDLIP